MRISQDEMELRKEIASHVSKGNAILSTIRFSERLSDGEAEKLRKAFAHFDEAEELSEEMEVGGARLSTIDEYARYKEMYAGLFGKCFEGVPFQVQEEVVNVLDSYVADSSEKMELLLRVRTLAGRQDVSPKVRLYLKCDMLPALKGGASCFMEDTCPIRGRGLFSAGVTSPQSGGSSSEFLDVQPAHMVIKSSLRIGCR